MYVKKKVLVHVRMCIFVRERMPDNDTKGEDRWFKPKRRGVALLKGTGVIYPFTYILPHVSPTFFDPHFVLHVVIQCTVYHPLCLYTEVLR